MVLAARPGGPAAAAEGGGQVNGLHLKGSKTVNLEHRMSDGGGYVWDIESYGSVDSGSNNAYSRGMYMYLQAGGSGRSGLSFNNQAKLNEAGDEVELGPRALYNIQVYRRIKVYKDRPLARWLDVFKNTSGGPVTINVQYHTITHWTMNTAATTSGDQTIDADDYGLVTNVTSGGNAPALMHVFGHKRSKLKPTVSLTNNQLNYHYSLEIPAGGTAVLCHFEAQNSSVEELKKQLANLNPREVLKDLSPEVRRLILNMPAGSGLGGLDLERLDSSDTLFRQNGDQLCGQVANERFLIQTAFGKLDLPAKDVIGMACGPEGLVRALLTDGQIVAGQSLTTRVQLKLRTGGDLAVPIDEITQWSYKISDARPAELEVKYPMAVLRSGQRLAFDPAKTPLELRTRHGRVPLPSAALLNVTFDGSEHGVHRVQFANGSQLGGLIEPETLQLTLALGSEYDIRRHEVLGLMYAAEPEETAPATEVQLSNGDVLFGQLITESLRVETEYGPLDIRREYINSLESSPTHLGRVALRVWPRTVLRGRLIDPNLRFGIAAGCELTLYANQIVRIDRPAALPPEDVVRRAHELVGRLSAESYRDRQAATEELKGLDPSLAGVLQQYANHSDPEVRQRVQEVIEAMKGRQSGPASKAEPIYQARQTQPPF